MVLSVTIAEAVFDRKGSSADLFSVVFFPVVSLGITIFAACSVWREDHRLAGAMTINAFDSPGTVCPYWSLHDETDTFDSKNTTATIGKKIDGRFHGSREHRIISGACLS